MKAAAAVLFALVLLAGPSIAVSGDERPSCAVV